MARTGVSGLFPPVSPALCRVSERQSTGAVRVSGIRRASISKLSLLSTIAADPPAGGREHGPAADARPWARGISPGVHGPAPGRQAGKQAEWGLRPAGDGGGRLSGPAPKSNGCVRNAGCSYGVSPSYALAVWGDRSQRRCACTGRGCLIGSDRA